MLKTVLEPEEGLLFVEYDAMTYLCVCVRLIAVVGDHSPLAHIPSVA